MAIKYVVIPEKRTVKAILENTEYDAYYKIYKMTRDTDFHVNPNRYRMPTRFVSEVFCDERDTFNEEFGKQRAKKIVLDNYYKSLDKRIDKFKEELLVLNGKIFKNCENNT